MSSIQGFRKAGLWFVDLVFPISCLVCGTDAAQQSGRASPTESGRGSYLCLVCQNKLPKLDKQQCLVCQTPAPFGKTHPNCVTRNSVDGVLAALTHKDRKVSEIIRTFKYNFVSSLSEPLAELIVETINKQGLQNYFQNFIVVPIPLHNRRFNWRGFNQAELLAQSLAKKLNIKVDNDLAARTKFTKPQVKLKAEERKRNIENAFKIIGHVAGQKILLVDDVVTSGSTANELAKLLKKEKAAEVWILTAAHG